MDSSVITVNDRTSEIKPKMHFTGTVVKTTLAFAVVDIGIGTPAVIHISQLTPATEGQSVMRVEDVLQSGQQVDVWVRKVKEGRIELTTTKPLEHDWRDLKKGMVVKGQVTKLEKFGAFVEIGAERPGLVHISEMAHGFVRTPADLVKEGDEVEVQVLDVNRRKKQIKLSMKALQEEPVKEEESARPAEGVEKGKGDRKRRSKRSDERGDDRGDGNMTFGSSSESTEADPTAMEIALREAMEKAQGRKNQNDKKRAKNVSQEQEEILARTLNNKVRTN
jgi:ribosomal protein S1